MKINRPVISVIVITYNRVKLLEKCLECLRNQETNKPYEVIIIDNGSTDNTKKIVEKFGFKYIFVQKKRKIERPRNYALNFVKGEIIAFTDDDALVDKNWIDEIFYFFKNNDALVVGGKIMNGSQGIIAETNHVFDFGKFYSDREKEVRTVPTVNSAYKRKAFSLEKFDDNLEVGEDSDLNWRIKKRGFKIFYSPKIIVTHISNNNLIKFFEKKYKQGQGFLLVRLKNPDIPLNIIKNKIIFLFLIPLYFCGSYIRGLKNDYLVKIPHKWIVVLPLLFIGYIFFWVGLTKKYLGLK